MTMYSVSTIIISCTTQLKTIFLCRIIGSEKNNLSSRTLMLLNLVLVYIIVLAYIVVILECGQTTDAMTVTTMMPRVLSPSIPPTLPVPLTCATDQHQSTTTYANSYSSYNPYTTESYMNVAKQRPAPYSRNMDYPTYHPRMNGLYPRSNLGYGYEAR